MLDFPVFLLVICWCYRTALVLSMLHICYQNVVVTWSLCCDYTWYFSALLLILWLCTFEHHVCLRTNLCIRVYNAFLVRRYFIWIGDAIFSAFYIVVTNYGRSVTVEWENNTCWLHIWASFCFLVSSLLLSFTLRINYIHKRGLKNPETKTEVSLLSPKQLLVILS